MIGWYPYYFLDPRQVSGPVEFTVSCAIALAVFAAVATALVLISRLPDPWDRTPAEPPPEDRAPAEAAREPVQA